MFSQRIADDPPPEAFAELSTLLTSLSRLYPPIFFKPIFQCAVSSKEFTIINHLCTLAIYAKYVDDLWTRDADMLAMAIMGDAGANLSEDGRMSRSFSKDGMMWGQAKLGQSIIMVEMIARLQRMRREKETSNVGGSLQCWGSQVS